ncbi:hypothetical protein PAXRUDRAFT_823663 [Paxillus rubicundulus Ve08.2h10]|uniref:Unplaced genomic scaffold scaffold_64, whole genome shotgun sequence n=1 Tax=Paxillus rubicundulus Ve08.2h10 TaxID=930991 RepID=A0A0D0EC23_9AGAM|nr:hypothetical protein PAXRUDRAFT_823663 [Paxillus rubicundulus Ve08.2h10]
MGHLLPERRPLSAANNKERTGMWMAWETHVLFPQQPVSLSLGDVPTPERKLRQLILEIPSLKPRGSRARRKHAQHLNALH